jgi:uncharacterized protein (TIGR02145 family)
MRLISPFKISTLLLGCLFLVFACKKDEPITTPDTTPEYVNEVVAAENTRLDAVLPKTTVAAYLQGVILDEDGQPVSDATVTSYGKSTTTDATGFFTFGEIPLNEKYAVVKATKTGFMTGIRTFTPRSGAFHRIEIQLMSKGVPQTIPSATGGVLEFESGMVKLNFPANAIATKKGVNYTGDVKVYARYIDASASNIAGVMPGMLAGLTNDNAMTSLISHGMVSVEMEDGNGNKLELASGSKVQVTLPAEASSAAEIPVWHFNENYGVWIESGTATKQENVFVFDANCFSVWNLDSPEAFGDVLVTLQESFEKPISNQEVEIFTRGFTKHLKTVWTDNEGKFTLLNAPLNMSIRFPFCGLSVTKDLSSFSENAVVTVDASDLLAAGALFYTLRGKMTDCNNVVYKNAYYSMTGIQSGVTIFTGKTNDEGNYSSSIIICVGGIDSMLHLVVHASPTLVKTDTIPIAFSGSTQIKNIDFCGGGIFNANLTYGSTTDINNNIYKTIKIGSQTWMAENLKVSKYRDGTPIPANLTNANWNSATTGAYSLYNNDAANNTKYGKLYNWYAVVDSRQLCPVGWHVPSDSEWKTLEINLGMSPADADDFLLRGENENVGGKLKSEYVFWKNPNFSATNESGFSGLPGGLRNADGSYSYIQDKGYWWSSTEANSTSIFFRSLGFDGGYSERLKIWKQTGYSVRCVKD